MTPEFVILRLVIYVDKTPGAFKRVCKFGSSRLLVESSLFAAVYEDRKGSFHDVDVGLVQRGCIQRHLRDPSHSFSLDEEKAKWSFRSISNTPLGSETWDILETDIFEEGEEERGLIRFDLSQVS